MRHRKRRRPAAPRREAAGPNGFAHRRAKTEDSPSTAPIARQRPCEVARQALAHGDALVAGWLPFGAWQGRSSWRAARGEDLIVVNLSSGTWRLHGRRGRRRGGSDLIGLKAELEGFEIAPRTAAAALVDLELAAMNEGVRGEATGGR